MRLRAGLGQPLERGIGNGDFILTGTGDHLPSLLVLPFVEVGIHQNSIGRTVERVILQGFLQLYDGIIVFPKINQCRSPGSQCFTIFRIQKERVFKLVDRLFIFSLQCQSESPIIIVFGLIRIQPGGLVELCLSFRGLPCRCE